MLEAHQHLWNPAIKAFIFFVRENPTQKSDHWSQEGFALWLIQPNLIFGTETDSEIPVSHSALCISLMQLFRGRENRVIGLEANETFREGRGSLVRGPSLAFGHGNRLLVLGHLFRALTKSRKQLLENGRNVLSHRISILGVYLRLQNRFYLRVIN